MNTPGLTKARWRAVLTDRKVWRAVLTDRKVWYAAATLVATLALILLLTVRFPASITHQTARLLSSTPVETSYGTRALYTAETSSGHKYSIRAPRPNLTLAPGEALCLQVRTDRFTGRVTSALVESATCNQ